MKWAIIDGGKEDSIAIWSRIIPTGGYIFPSCDLTRLAFDSFITLLDSNP